MDDFKPIPTPIYDVIHCPKCYSARMPESCDDPDGVMICQVCGMRFVWPKYEDTEMEG